MQDGQRVRADELIQRLRASQLLQKLQDARAMPYGSADLKGICDWLSNEWASKLLSDSYGTGEYLMYGAFIVDLEACTITDDPKADPIVQNIEIVK
jgi:hypothetical protein